MERAGTEKDQPKVRDETLVNFEPAGMSSRDQDRRVIDPPCSRVARMKDDGQGCQRGGNCGSEVYAIMIEGKIEMEEVYDAHAMIEED
jgi:hypothetical protein